MFDVVVFVVWNGCYYGGGDWKYEKWFLFYLGMGFR